MEDPIQSPAATSEVEARLTVLENALKLDERLKTLETALATKGLNPPTPLPWYKKGIPVAALTAILAALIPGVTAVSGIIKNQGDAERQKLEQLDKIRQLHFDRFFKSDINEDNQKLIIDFLAIQKTDPDLQGWAKDQQTKLDQKIKNFREEIQKAEKENKDKQTKIDELENNVSTLVGKDRAKALDQIRKLKIQVAESRQKTTDLGSRIGERPAADVTEKETLMIELSSTQDGVQLNVTSKPEGARLELHRMEGGGRLPFVMAPGTIEVPRGVYSATVVFPSKKINSGLVNASPLNKEPIIISSR